MKLCSGEIMKAFLLAAGYGTRLRPITDSIPKCLVPICGKPLLEWWMELFENHGISDVLINTHYLRDSVANFIKSYNRKGQTQLHEVYEPNLLGSGGTIRDNEDFVSGDEQFLICYADNLTNTNLTNFLGFHKQQLNCLSMALFHTSIPKQCGIAKMDKNYVITEFVEKPEHPKSTLANAGIYVASKEIFSFFGDKKILDLGRDVLPLLVGKMSGWEDTDYLIDIGTIENYKKAQIEWKQIIERT